MNSLVFKNGQLLRYGVEYDYLPSMSSIDYGEYINQTSYIHFTTALESNDQLKIINGLNPRIYTGILGTRLDTMYNINQNSLVLKNGVLFCGENSWTIDSNNKQIMVFGTPLRNGDMITIIPNYNTNHFWDPVNDSIYDGNKLDTNMILYPDTTLIWLNDVLLTNEVDYTINGFTIEFNVQIDDNSFLWVSTKNEDAIYNAINDKQDALPNLPTKVNSNLKNYKVLANNGSGVEWVSTSDGVYHPANDEELKKILYSSIQSGAIDFSNFDYSTFDENGYIINNKFFTFRNFSLSTWNCSNFKWFKKPVFTLNNSQIIGSPFVINASDIVVDDETDNEPLIKANNSGFQLQIGTITASNIDTTSKIALIELNKSTAHFTNYLLSLNGTPILDDDPIDNTGLLLEVNSSPDILFSECVCELFNFKHMHSIKYIRDIPTSLKLNRTDLVCGSDDIQIIIPDNSDILLSHSVVGKINTLSNNEEPNIFVNGRWYSAEDDTNKIKDFECMDYGFRANGLTLNTDQWHFPIHDENLQSDNAQDAIKELATRSGSLNPQFYKETVEVADMQDMDGEIEIINMNAYLSVFTQDRWMQDFYYDGNDWRYYNEDDPENQDIVDLNNLGIDVSNANYSEGSIFSIYSVCFRGKDIILLGRNININMLWVNGILYAKDIDYTVDENNRIHFNNYTLSKTDILGVL
jgi:hypothetical protein